MLSSKTSSRAQTDENAKAYLSTLRSSDERCRGKLNSTARTTVRGNSAHQPLGVTVCPGYTNSLPEQTHICENSAITKNEVEKNSTVRHATMSTCSACQAVLFNSSRCFHKHAPSARTHAFLKPKCRVEFLSGAESSRDENWTIYCTRFII